MLITVIYTIIFLNHHLPFFSLKCGIMIKKDIKMEDIKKFLWIIFFDNSSYFRNGEYRRNVRTTYIFHRFIPFLYLA
nr:hypothetical protein CFF04554_0684 [Campylobacter fetus subsp. fetus 04/554]